MNNIKFRAWDKIDKVMLTVNTYFFYYEYVWLNVDNKKNCLRRKLDEVEIMQFTGLVDSNNIEIYEGDLINFFGQTCEIIYEDGAFWVEDVRESSLSDCSDSLLRDIHTDIQVIGNIYENPDLCSKE